MSAGGSCDLCLNPYLFLVFSDLNCHLEGAGIAVFWMHCGA